MMNKIEEKKLFKIAKLAKEKGFKTKTVTTGFTNDYLLGGKNVMITEMCIYLWMCELQKWLREVHNCFIDILPHRDGDSKNKQWKSKKDVFWSVEVDYYGKKFEIPYTEESDFIKTFNNSYEKALEIGIFQALKLIK